MKIFTWLMAAALLCSTQISYADESCNTNSCETNSCDLCDFDFCDVTSAVYADYLYLKPCRSDLDSNPGYTSAYRLGAVFSYELWDLGVNYTSLCTSESGYKLDYDVINIQLARTFDCHCDDMVITPFIGTKLAWIDEKYDGKMDHDSYGLYLGSNIRWDLCSFDACDYSIPVALVSRGSYGVQHATVNNQCSYMTVVEAFVGLDFTFCDVFCGTNGNFQIGYEVQSWSSFNNFDNDNHLASFGIDGLVTRFGLSF